MADFRKNILLAAMTLAIGVGTASAQTGTPACIGTNGAVPTLRAEGQTELTGNIVLSCSNITSGFVNFDVLLNGGTVPITSRETPVSEAMVTVSYNGVSQAPIAASQYVSTNGGPVNDARFTGVPITAPNPVITISGIRGNMNSVFSTTSGIGQVLATVSVSNGILPITQNNGGFFVGLVEQGLGVISGTATTGFTVQSCSGGAPIPSGTGVAISIPENFPTAFKPQSSLMNSDSETGTTPGALEAQSATQFAVTFTNIPSGVIFYVPETITSPVGGVAELVVGEGNPLGASPSSSYILGSSLGLLTTDPNYNQLLAPVTTGLTFFYNVTLANPNAIDIFQMTTYPTGTVSASTGAPTLSVVLAPRAVVNSVQSLAVPRFISLAAPIALPGFTVTPCQTTLLFPYMTNQAGFDTGFSIAATSQDPFGTFAQGGTCTLNFYNGTTTPPPAVTLTVPTGGEGHNTLSSPTVAPNFQGYMIAVCDFQYAHGYAFLSNGFSGIGNGGLSEGYVALEVGNTRLGTPSTSVNGIAGGEGLLH